MRFKIFTVRIALLFALVVLLLLWKSIDSQEFLSLYDWLLLKIYVIFHFVPDSCYRENTTQSTPPFEKYTISAAGINATFVANGARLVSLFVKDKNGIPQDIVLGFDNPADYVPNANTNYTYFGPVIGRYGNRIKNGTFTIEGETYHIPKNENNGQNTLHGGQIGYDQRNWTLVSHTATSITFSLFDYAFEGFPGTVISYATYTLSPGPRWTSRIVSIPIDKPTPLMLMNHIYWNLDAFSDPNSPTVLNHTLHMPYSTRYIKVDRTLIPTGAIGTVNHTFLDFTTPKQIGADILSSTHNCGPGCLGYDNDFIIDRPQPPPHPPPSTNLTDLPVLTLSSPTTGIILTLKTNQPAIQIYTCNDPNTTIPLKNSQQQPGGNVAYVPQYGCVVIETQGWIDAVNHPEWGRRGFQIFAPDSDPKVVWQQYDFRVVG